jgi:hypothetical protein
MIEISPKEYETLLNWHDGMLYCQLLTIDNKNDWRLPTIEELQDIYHSENDFYDTYYWSLTKAIIHDNYVWMKSFNNGNTGVGSMIKRMFIRPVRTI